ncbi:MAG: DEAD/DEAH box helicase [Cytophagales bacterium]|nr:DEAD/DEAH box helicase [Cytophagales bacterium]
MVLYQSLFRGRMDVFAVHWQKGKKSGYMPAYDYDPYMYRRHKMNGGTFRDFEHKSYAVLTDREIHKHLYGEQLIGVYPLLLDNSSHFIAADFDGENWLKECLIFQEACKKEGMHPYLERSKSGNGGHTWVFFDSAYPAFKSRKVFQSLLERSGMVSAFDKNSSFDRLFPNQDMLSGKGLGNLIALPFYGSSLKEGNSCFINDNGEPYADQWAFLKTVQRTSVEQLDELFGAVKGSKCQVSKVEDDVPAKLSIRLRDAVHINRFALSSGVINFLKEELNFANSDYFIKKKSGRNTWDTKRYFTFIEETENEVVVPRGFVGTLLRYLKQNSIDHSFIDQRIKRNTVPFAVQFELYPYQETVTQAASKKDFGIIVSPPGTGKTIIGLKIIADKQQPALIIVHRKQLLQQWTERIQAFLGIPKREIGSIGQGKAKVGEMITVGMIQSLGKQLEKETIENLKDRFGTIIIDECHHLPAKSYADTISKLNPYYQYGLTATPFRKGSDGKAIFIHLGNIIASIQVQDLASYKRPKIVVRNTDLDIPFNSKTDTFETLSKVLVHDSARNQLILKDVKVELEKGKRTVIITERKEHITVLEQWLKQSYEVITLSGDDTYGSRESKWKELKLGNYQVLITTGQYFGEGTDLHNASCLFLAYPFSFKGKLIQYIGRVQRADIAPTVYDYHDHKIAYLSRLFLKRNVHYRGMERQASLFDDREKEVDLSEKMGVNTFDKEIKVSFDALDFRYGSVVFKLDLADFGQVLEFEVENDEIRPEFEVLKPYFAKILHLNKVKIHVYAEFQEGKLIAQTADSVDLRRINQEIIESVKFRFVRQNIVKKQPQFTEEGNIVNLDQLQNDQAPLYNAEEDLLHDLLKQSRVKHFHQLRYLASKHDRDTLKIRFVLSPFSFVFLLKGVEQYHIVLETLDTEEATYAWHFNKQELPAMLKEIDQHLNIIRNHGRQAFLETQPENFSRLLHDYADERKGFMIWKGMLEERLV